MADSFQIGFMRAFFDSGATRPASFRRVQLRNLMQSIRRQEPDLLAALYADLNKSPVEACLSETAFVQHEIRHATSHVNRWMRPRRVPVPLGLHPARAAVTPVPKGVVLIIAPWNYPLQLALSPLVAAIAAGNCAVIKPSELAEESSAALYRLIAETFDPRFVRVVEGGRDTAQMLLNEPFDHLFFTGGTETGRRVAEAAARRLIPTTLELGGKSPVVIGQGTDLAVAARRIARGKFMNAGQTCVAPDHVWVPRPLFDPLCAELKKAITTFYGPRPEKSPDFARIINPHHVERLRGLLTGTSVVFGGECSPESRYVAPTLIANPALDSPVMSEEIFGPLLPLIAYDHDQEPIDYCRRRPPPLALYLFGNDRRQQQQFMREIPSGGVCINDTISQLIPRELPFGGRGESGSGLSHGHAGFATFSHFRSELRRTLKPDPIFTYPPYRLPPRWIKRAGRLFF